MESKEVADDGRHDGEGPYGVHLQEFLFRVCRGWFGGLGRDEGEEDDHGCGAANGQVDVETPAPGKLFGEDASEEGAHNAGNTIGCAEQAGEGGALGGGGAEGYDGVTAACDARAAGAGDGSADDERRATVCNGADEASDFEDQDREEEGWFYGEVLVGFAPGALEAGYGQEKR